MRVTVAYNLRTELDEAQAELLVQEDVDRLVDALTQLRHKVAPVEVSGRPNDIVERLLESEPDLIFNVAEGTVGSAREAFYPGLYEQLGIPFTGGNASLLHMNLDKHLAKTVVAARGIQVPRGVLVTRAADRIPEDLRYPLILKPNSEGSSKGITQDSVVETPDACRRRLERLLGEYPLGVIVEEFIRGRELSVPFLEAYPGRLLEIVEHQFDLARAGGKFNIYDYDMKQGGEAAKAVSVACPPALETHERQAVLDMARHVFDIMACPDFGRVDVRLHEDGTPYFIELNPLPALHPAASLMTAAHQRGLEYRDAIRLILRSAARRYGLAVRSPAVAQAAPATDEARREPRPTAREVGVLIGRFRPGVHNAITDVKGVRVGHVTRIEADVQIPGVPGTTNVCTGVTAILPAAGNVYERRLVASGHVLNGVGEMTGLDQVMEWGWLETPIVLTNSHSVGSVHRGVISYLTERYPKIGVDEDVVLPVIGEADDRFLNDVRVGLASATDARRAIEVARSGPVEQGSVGAGTGMTSFDFAGGIGTASRCVPLGSQEFQVGVLVLSNFGRLRNLTIDGRVVGRDLDGQFAAERRTHDGGSVVTVVATDAPLLSSQLARVARRAALGLARVGSLAASSSGEFVIAFSTAARVPRTAEPFLNLRFVADAHVNDLYEGTIEATEEAVVNALFCSHGMRGRLGRECPAIPEDRVVELLRAGRTIH